MGSAIGEWIEKAEEDFHVALSLRRSRRHPAHNATCFHAQQCVEKYLKALLEKRGAVVHKIHALPVLLDQCVEAHPLLAPLRPDMVRLSVYAVEFRYPGESATLEDAKSSVTIMKRARTALRDALGLPATTR
jgi:HEPN domain-containing protein